MLALAVGDTGAVTEGHLARALQLVEARHGAQARQLGPSLYYLAQLYMARHAWAPADRALKRLLTLYRDAKAHDLVAGVSKQLGQVAEATQQLNLAEHYYRAALRALDERTEKQGTAQLKREVLGHLVHLYEAKMPGKAIALQAAREALAGVRDKQ